MNLQLRSGFSLDEMVNQGMEIVRRNCSINGKEHMHTEMLFQKILVTGSLWKASSFRAKAALFVVLRQMMMTRGWDKARQKQAITVAVFRLKNTVTTLENSELRQCPDIVLRM